MPWTVRRDRLRLLTSSSCTQFIPKGFPRKRPDSAFAAAVLVEAAKADDLQSSEGLLNDFFGRCRPRKGLISAFRTSRNEAVRKFKARDYQRLKFPFWFNSAALLFH